MHLLIPFAGASCEAARQALVPQQLPHLARLLARMVAGPLDSADPSSLTPPHERALARGLDWPAAEDGRWPVATLAAITDGLHLAGRPAGLLTPMHWVVGSDQVTALDPEVLALSPTESGALLESARPLFEDAGWELHWGHAVRWYGVHPSLADLRTASLDRVIGRGVDAWMPDGADARALRRLQAEVQMLWARDPVNAAREDRGALPVNSFWLSGCGVLAADTPPPGPNAPQVQPQLRAAALAGDWPAWALAWQQLDAGPLRALLRGDGKGLTLTLCGERNAQRFDTPVTASWQSWLTRWRAASVRPVLEAL